VAFDLLKFLTMVLGGFGIAGLEAEAQKQLEKIKADYPDVSDQVSALESWLTDKLAGTTDVAKMTATIRGIAMDIVNGTAGIDPQAWQGSV